MERQQSTIVIIGALAFLAIGGLLAELLISSEGGSYEGWGTKSLYLIRFTTLIAIWYLYTKIGDSSPKLKLWFTNTFGGVSAMLSCAGFFIVLLPNLYMHLPLIGWLHFSFALVLGLVASTMGFYLIAGRNS